MADVEVTEESLLRQLESNARALMAADQATKRRDIHEMERAMKSTLRSLDYFRARAAQQEAARAPG